MKRIIYFLAALIFFATLWGCSSEPRSVTMHKPGIYKGEKDELLALKNQQNLVDRLKLVQTDR
jgi:hypothetical protein